MPHFFEEDIIPRIKANPNYRRIKRLRRFIDWDFVDQALRAFERKNFRQVLADYMGLDVDSLPLVHLSDRERRQIIRIAREILEDIREE